MFCFHNSVTLCSEKLTHVLWVLNGKKRTARNSAASNRKQTKQVEISYNSKVYNNISPNLDKAKNFIQIASDVLLYDRYQQSKLLKHKLKRKENKSDVQDA